ncbi:hypothetical protein TNCV_5019881 [Trichonephila clavipes]|nr:hypothetical protein TNCV_5019881 [Trichonephila clavipes]
MLDGSLKFRGAPYHSYGSSYAPDRRAIGGGSGNFKPSQVIRTIPEWYLPLLTSPPRHGRFLSLNRFNTWKPLYTTNRQ